MVQKNKKGKYPLYVSVYDSLMKEIETKKYKPGDQLPNENELAKYFGVSRNTLRQALLLLIEDGILTNHQGKGTFVLMSRPSTKSSLEKLIDPLNSLAISKVDSIETKIEIRKISPKHQKIFNLETSNLLILLEIVYKVGEKPIGCALTFVPYNAILKENVPLDNMEKIYEFYKKFFSAIGLISESVLRIVYARDPVTTLLKDPKQHQLLMMDEIFRKPNGNVALTQKLFFQPDEYEFTLFRRNDRSSK